MSLKHRLSRTALAAVACLAAFAAVASEPPVTDAATLATLDKVLAGDHRSDAEQGAGCLAPPEGDARRSSACART